MWSGTSKAPNWRWYLWSGVLATRCMWGVEVFRLAPEHELICCRGCCITLGYGWCFQGWCTTDGGGDAICTCDKTIVGCYPIHVNSLGCRLMHVRQNDMVRIKSFVRWKGRYDMWWNIQRSTWGNDYGNGCHRCCLMLVIDNVQRTPIVQWYYRGCYPMCVRSLMRVAASCAWESTMMVPIES